MDLNFLTQIKDKKGLISDITFYVSISLLISAVLCYFIFSAKITSQKQVISQIDSSMLTIGTDLQKQKEAAIFNYQRKINNFSILLNNHKSVLNILALLEQQTVPKVWFSRFNLSENENSVVLSGEAENMQVLSQQVLAFETNEYVAKIDVLNSSVGNAGRITFNLNVVLNPKIFIPLQPVAPVPSINSNILNNITGTVTPSQ